MEDQGYVLWKRWSSTDFGHVTPVSAAYFSAEIQRCMKFHSLIPFEASFLEVGFGNGSFLSYARQRGYSIEATEVNATLVRLARNAGYNAVQTSEIKVFPSGSKDIVLAFDVLEHLSPSSLEAFFYELTRVLKPGGLLFARFPNADSPFGLEGQNGDPSHLNSIGIGKVKYYCQKHNLNLEFYGAEAAPLISGSLPLTIRRLFTQPLKKILDALVLLIFLPGSGISFSARNTVIILRK